MPETGTSERYEMDITASEVLQEIDKMKKSIITNKALTAEQFHAVHLARKPPNVIQWVIFTKWFNKKYNTNLAARSLGTRYERELMKRNIEKW